MSKRSLALGLIAFILLGLGGYWFFNQRPAESPPIASLAPAQTLGFLALPGLPQAWKDLQQSRFYRHVSSATFWRRALGEDGYQRITAEKQQLEQQLGFPLTEQTMSLLLGREIGLALVPSRGSPWLVDVIVYCRISGTEKLAETFARTFSTAMQHLARETQVVDGIEVVTLRPREGTGRVSYALLESLAVLSTDPAWVIDAIKSRQMAPHDRLSTTALFQAMQLETAESLLAYGYYDVTGIQALARTPGGGQPPPAAALSMLQTTDKVSLKAVRVANGGKAEAMALYPPSGAPRIFRDVSREGARPPFQGVPAEAFYLTHIDLLDLRGLWQLCKQLAALNPQNLLRFEQQLARFRAWIGVDPERDVLPVFTGAGGVGLTPPLGSQPWNPTALPGVFLTLEITDEPKTQQLLQSIGMHADGSTYAELLQRRAHDGHTIYYLNLPFLFIKPGYVISRQQLILGSDVALLQHMLDAAAGRTPALSETVAYREVHQHFRIKSGSLTFIDVTTASEKLRDTWSRLGFLIRALLPVDPGASIAGPMRGDLSALLELLRPIHYIGAASQAESQGVRTEAFIVLEDLK
jgi:hypothetical protein